MQFAKKAHWAAVIPIFVALTGTTKAQGPSPITKNHFVVENLPPLPATESVPEANPLPKKADLSPDTMVMNSRKFSIPFKVGPVKRKPVEVQLLISRGDSKWRILDRQPPNVQKFLFNGDEDGLFWFATRTIDPFGEASPEGEIVPQLKVFIDTTQPDLRLQASADATGVVKAVLSWGDATKINGMKLYFATDIKRRWEEVNTSIVRTNQEFSFTPKDNWQQLLVQAVATDSAGNHATAKQLIQRPRVAAIPPRLASMPPNWVQPAAGPTKPDATIAQNPVHSHPINQHPLTGAPPVSVPTNGLPIRGAVAPEMQPPASPQFPFQNQPGITPGYQQPIAPGAQGPIFAPGAQGPTFAQGAQGPTFAQGAQGPPTFAPSADVPTFAPPTPPSLMGDGGNVQELPAPRGPEEIETPNPIALEGPGGQPASSGPEKPRTVADAMRPMTEIATPAQPTPAGDSEPEDGDDKYAAKKMSEPSYDRALFSGRVPVRYSDSERFSLEYELEAVGSNGAKAVELYGSLTRGNSWLMWGEDPDRVTPFDIETKGEGVFGFRIVVVGANGLASPRPLAGDTPEIVIVVDKTKPKVKITSAQYGDGNRTGALVIGYDVQDANLKSRPVALSFSETPDGPWTTIAAGLTNEKFYVWPADPNMPRQIYLRLDATDRAGNVGTYVLDEPIETQGLAPRARIRGFRSLSGNEPPNDDEQTAIRPKASFK